MLRIILTQIILFLLPFACYAGWLWLTKRNKDPDSWTRGPIAWLSLAGVLLVIAGLIVFALFTGNPEGREYIPSGMKDGVFVPGRYE